MAAESKARKKRRVAKIIDILREAYPDARCALDHTNPLELLVATVLSAQCTDRRVNVVTKGLFARYRTAADYAAAEPAALEQQVRSTGFFRNKAANIRAACRQIVERHGGKVPDTMEALVALPGVARKTANVVLGNAFGTPSIIVDTHVLRVSGRLGLASPHNVEHKYADKIEQELMEACPKPQWTRFSNLLSFHGRCICIAGRPRCPICPVNSLCPYPNKTKA